jgi:hypothetical protein
VTSWPAERNALAEPFEDTQRDEPATAARLTVLAMGTDDWATEQVATALDRAGHTILRCHEPGEPSFPCNAMIAGRICPLDVGYDVAVTTRARSHPNPAQGEFGVICTVRHRIPLVVAGVAGGDVFTPWAAAVVEQGADVATACEQAVAQARGAAATELREAAR